MSSTSFVSPTSETPDSPAVPERAHALSIIRSEHKSIGMVLNEMKRVTDVACTAHAAFDCTSLKAMLDYLKNFSEKLHHPKEDFYLFAKLRQRTKQIDPTIAELEQHHAAGGAMISRLEEALARFEAGKPHAFEEFRSELDRFCEAQWQHMHLEEGIVLPAAEKYLSQDDWTEISAAFGQNGDSGFGPLSGIGFQKMYSNILRATD